MVGNSTSAQPGSPPRSLLLAGFLVGLEGLALVGLAVRVGVSAVVGRAGTTASGLGTAALLLLGAAVVGWAGAGLVRARVRARAPAVLAQLIQLGLAWSFAGGGTVAWAVVLAVAALTVLTLVFLPGATAALVAEE